jgi:hypothetical protein
MSMTKRETFQAAEKADNSLWPEVRLSETDRLEAFTTAWRRVTYGTRLTLHFRKASRGIAASHLSGAPAQQQRQLE